MFSTISNTYAYSRNENGNALDIIAKLIISYALGNDTKRYF